MSQLINISEYQLDALREHLNIGMGVAAGTLNQMLDTRVQLHVPRIHVIPLSDVAAQLALSNQQAMSTVKMEFKGQISGSSSVMFNPDSAARLVRLLVPESDLDTHELNAITESTLSEVGNIIINAVIGSVANLCQLQLHFHPPFYTIASLTEAILGRSQVAADRQDSVVVIGDTHFHVEEEQIVGRLSIVFMVSELQKLLRTWTEQAA